MLQQKLWNVSLHHVSYENTAAFTGNAEDEEYQERQTISLAKFWHDVDMMYFSDNSILQDTANLDMKTNTLPPSSPDSDENKVNISLILQPVIFHYSNSD